MNHQSAASCKKGLKKSIPTDVWSFLFCQGFRKTTQRQFFFEKNHGFVDSEIVKTCDELDSDWGGPFSTQACISFSLTDSSRRLRSKLNQIVDTTLAEIEDII